MTDLTTQVGTQAAEQAKATLELHFDDGTGYCEGCTSEFDFLVPHPCTVQMWANRTLIIELPRRTPNMPMAPTASAFPGDGR